jgi:hypothetical protein
MDCMTGGMGWMHGGMALLGVLLVVSLILSIAALIKYLRRP